MWCCEQNRECGAVSRTENVVLRAGQCGAMSRTECGAVSRTECGAVSRTENVVL